MVNPSHLSLFTGIGGIDLAAEWAWFETVGQVEMDKYCIKTLEKNFGPDIPRWKDVRDVTKESFYEKCGERELALLSGGFPCQPFSCAGKQKGRGDDRYLWPEMLRVVRELRPAWVLGENVAGIINMELGSVLSDLEGEGYSVRAFVIPACGVGAWHRRERVFIVANNNSPRYNRRGQPNGCASEGFCQSKQTRREDARGEIERCDQIGSISNTNHPRSGFDGLRDHGKRTPESEGRGRIAQFESCTCCEDVSNTNNPIGPFGWEDDRMGTKWISEKEIDRGTWSGKRQWKTEPGMGRVVNGIPRRVDRLRALGNAVVPQQVYPILKGIRELL